MSADPRRLPPVTDADFWAYLTWLNREGPRTAAGRLILTCEQCGQEIGEYATFHAGHYRETGEAVLVCLHDECAPLWVAACWRKLAPQ